MSNNQHRLVSTLTEATVIGALMQNLDWVYLPKVSLKQSDFSSLNHQVIYSILRDKYLEDVREISQRNETIDDIVDSVSMRWVKASTQLIQEQRSI